MLGPSSIIIARSDVNTKVADVTDVQWISRLNIDAEAKRGGYLVYVYLNSISAGESGAGAYCNRQGVGFGVLGLGNPFP